MDKARRDNKEVGMKNKMLPPNEPIFIYEYQKKELEKLRLATGEKIL